MIEDLYKKQMKEKVCSFIGHRYVTVTEKLKIKLKSVIEKLITLEKVYTFLFGSASRFDELCLSVVSELKEVYPEIKRVYVRSVYPVIGKKYEVYLLGIYDETYMPEGIENSGRASYVERNRKMIDGSDFIVFYYDEGYATDATRKTNSGTRLAYEYAVRKSKDGKKQIINLYEGEKL